MGILFVTMIWKDQSCIFGSWCISFIWNLNFSLGLSYTERWTLLSPVWLFATPWTVQYMEFSSLEYWSGKPFPSPGDLLNPGIKPRSPTLQADSLPAEPQRSPGILEYPGVPWSTRAYPFSRGSSRPRNQSGVSCIAGGFFTSWAIWGAHQGEKHVSNSASAHFAESSLGSISAVVIEIQSFLNCIPILALRENDNSYWVGEKVCSDFSRKLCGKIWMNFLASPVYSSTGPRMETISSFIHLVPTHQEGPTLMRKFGIIKVDIHFPVKWKSELLCWLLLYEAIKGLDPICIVAPPSLAHCPHLKDPGWHTPHPPSI